MSKILIVDDDVTMTELLKTLLKIEGHTPMAVNDSTKAVEVAGSVNPDLITLDLMMPGLSGFELCELLHQDPKFAHIPIIILSARDDAESKEKTMRAGAKDYVTKPFDADELMEKIKRLTSSQRS
ncbi:MAG: response regulator transcription factor [Anaerolineales bacterium]